MTDTNINTNTNTNINTNTENYIQTINKENYQIIKFNSIGSACLADYFKINIKDFMNLNKLNYQDIIFRLVLNTDKNYLKIYNALNNCSHCVKIINDKFVEEKYLEVFQRFNLNLVNLKNQMNLRQIKKIINYLIYIQLEMFDEYGFIWKKLSGSNIFIEHCNQSLNLVFKYNNKTQKLKSNTIIRINDFEQSIFLDPSQDFLNFYIDNKTLNALHTDESTSLIIKLYKSFILGLELSTDKKILNRFINQTEDIKQVCYVKSNKLFNKYKTLLLDHPDDLSKWSEAYATFKDHEFQVAEMLLSYCWECFDRLAFKKN